MSGVRWGAWHSSSVRGERRVRSRSIVGRALRQMPTFRKQRLCGRSEAEGRPLAVRVLGIPRSASIVIGSAVIALIGV